MKDIPMFTTENGVASLFLKEIPYSGIARVKIHSSLSPSDLLDECVSFCRACGAETVHASGQSLNDYPLVAEIWEMRGSNLGDTDAMLFPLMEENAELWRQIANDRFSGIDNAATLTKADCVQMAKEGSAYFIHRDGELFGIGKVGDSSIDLIASVKPGFGADIMRALASVLPQDGVILRVASTNDKATKLYKKLGFVCTDIISKWYKIF